MFLIHLLTTLGGFAIGVIVTVCVLAYFAERNKPNLDSSPVPQDCCGLTPEELASIGL